MTNRPDGTTPVHHRTALPLTVLLAGMALSLLLALSMRQEIERDAAERFDTVALDLSQRIEGRFADYGAVLAGMRARFHAEPPPSRKDFADYVAGLDLAQSHPGFQAVSFAPSIAAADKAAFEARLRADPTLASALARSYTIRPAGERDDYHPVAFVEPLAGREPLLGTDIAALPNRRQALAHARDSGELVSFGGRLPIAGHGDEVDLTLRLPVYRPGRPLDTVERRRAAYLGSVGAGFSVSATLRDALAPAATPGRRLRLLDGGPSTVGRRLASRFASAPGGQLLFDSGPPATGADAARFERTLAFDFGARAWLVEVSDDEQAYRGRHDAALAALVGVAGIVISALLAGVIWSLGTGRRRALARAHAMTRHLRDSERQLEEAQRLAGIGGWVLDVASGRLHCTTGALRLLGLEQGGPPDLAALLDRVPESDRARIGRLIAEAAAERTEFEHRLRLPGGGERWLHVTAEPAERDGRAQVRGVLRDDTQRHRSARRLQLEHDVARRLLDDGEGIAVVARALESACQHLHWDCAALWRVDDDGLARCTVAWHVAGADAAVQQFVRQSRSLVLPATEGALGHAWAQAEPVRSERLAARDDGSREAAAGAAGLTLGLVVPMVAAGATTALEFFAADAAAADVDGIDSLRVIALQIAQYGQRQQAERRLRFFASHDALTGLSNRDALQHALQRAIKRAQRQHKRLALMFIDLDRFKHVNDTLGHGAGDALIRSCGERLAGLLRKDDTVARFGGDEFVLLLENLAGPADAADLAKRALAALAEPYQIEGHELHVGASIGLSVYPEDGFDAETLVKNADAAMYRAKDNGRGTYRFYTAQMNAHAAERLALESGLRRALARQELELHYQPKLEIATRRIVGVEALMRWRHPVRGMVPPDRFIPIAEEAGLIDAMGHWALRRACADAMAWRAAGLPPLQVSVNVSARQLGSRSLLHEIRAALEDAGLEPGLLEVELTESAMMKNPEQAAKLLGDIRALGVGLAVDDFGTGYSSLSYLRRFPLSAVKIDRSFVNGLEEHDDARAVVGSIITLAHGLRMKVVAEGVETTAQLADLQARGCDLAQGWLVAKALPANELAAFVAQHDAAHAAAQTAAPEAALVG